MTAPAAGKEVRLLRGEGLTKAYKSREVVQRVSVSIAQGEIMGLLGPNGAGKTTTFYMIVGLVRPSEGRVYLGSSGSEVDITDLPMYKRARAGIAYLPQEASVFRKLTVEENILAVLEARSVPAAERKPRVEALLEELGIARLRTQKGETLSGGERRRVEITRALACDPSFILLDEPFVGIDHIAVEDIRQVMKQLAAKGIGILVTDHSVREILGAVDRAYLIFDGKIMDSGTAAEIASSPRARQLYLGEGFRL